ncbi:hypothetical protein pb186bvf_019737, partial [Paramecium bursaria]
MLRTQYNRYKNAQYLGQNYFIGNNYFYSYFTKNGTFTDLSKLTFILWVKFTGNNLYNKKTGRQILFQLVDGPNNNSFVNLQLSVYVNNGLQLAAYSGDVTASYAPQVILPLTNTEDATNLLGWNQIVISIDQSQQISFINLKFYDSYRKTNYQLQYPSINRTIFNYKLSQQIRITNEVLIDQDKSDQRACAYIANFEYYIGWVTMDTEPFLEYSSNLSFYLKPVNSLDQISENQIPMKSQSGIYYNNIGLKIYKNTRVEYVFKEQMNSFIFSFWMNPNIVSDGLINPNYQLFSFTDDSLLKTAIGIGINNKLKLLLYQNYNQRQLTQLQVGWSHVVAYFVQNSWDNDFNPSSKKQVYIFVNGTNITDASATPTVEGIFQWSRIVIGLLFRDLQDQNYVIVQEMKIFSGMALQKSQFGCILQAASDNPFCILCDISQPSSSFCQEDQTPFSTSSYLCPQGQYKVNNNCTAIPVANCSRYDSGACTACNYGFSLQWGQCVAGTLPNLQQCQTGASSCNITTSLGDTKQLAITCLQGYSMLERICKQQQSSDNCNLFMNSGCYNCPPGKSLKINSVGKLQCIPQCSQPAPNKDSYIFDDKGICKQICPRNASYSFDCKLNVSVVQCLDVCPPGWAQVNEGICVDPITAPIYLDTTRNQNISRNFNQATLKNMQILFPKSSFNTSKLWIQGFQGCQAVVIKDPIKNVTNITIKLNVTNKCNHPCGLCFGGSRQQQCLTCQDKNQYLDRQSSNCVSDCNRRGQLLRLNNTLNMTCESKCPYGSVQQDYNCTLTCNQGYINFFGVCVLKIPNGYYKDTTDSSIKICPEVCEFCKSATECTKCIGSYPKYGTMCVSQCPYFLDFDSNTCVNKCKDDDLVFETGNLNNFKFKICYKQKCGYVQANKRIPTVSHQTEAKVCRQPCDEKYYADQEKVKCMPCKSPCVTCQEK